MDPQNIVDVHYNGKIEKKKLNVENCIYLRSRTP